jgi:hypothetical protein
VRRGLLFLAPALVVLAAATAPLAIGHRTLVLRDVLNSHLALRASYGVALRSGELPEIDPLRAGGQPLLGNPNTVALYPDDLLLLAGSTLWQLNFHFVLHWWLALAAAYWLGRAWGLGREGAAGAATVYALSGFFFSQLNLFNAVAAAAWAPAMMAAALELGAERTRRRATAALGALWALGLLGGDPILAALALAAAVAVAWARHGRSYPVRWLLLACTLGSVVAAPQIVETARVLPESLRGFWGYPGSGFTARDPRTLLDLLIPVFFGRPDRNATWGEALFGGHPPLYFSLAPGLVALALAGAAGRPRGRDRYALAALALAGLAAAYGGGAAAMVSRWPGAGLFRYPEKLALWPTVALAIAAGAGIDRLLSGRNRRPLAWALAALTLPTLALWLGFGAGGPAFARAVQSAFAPALDAATYGSERLRWAGLAMIGLALVALAAVVVAATRRRPAAAGFALLALQAASQTFFLSPLIPTDEASYYQRRPALADRIPAGSVVAHGGVNDLFGPGYAAVRAGELPDDRYFWLERRAHDELYGFAGMLAGIPYEFNYSPEGLDSFVVAAVGQAMRQTNDPQRVALLRATGVDRLLLERPLAPDDAGGAREVAAVPGWGRTMRVYEIPDPLPAAAVVGEVRFAPDMNSGLETILAPGFDPRATAVVAGSGAPRDGPAGSLLERSETRERITVELDSAAGGFLVLRRAYLPIWRAAVDGRPARPVIAQMTRLAVEVPAGRHRVELWIPRGPLRVSLAAACLGLAAMLAVALPRRRRREPEP